MFDFGFSEVLLTSVIALIVLGPEKLPKAASQVGRWVGRARAMARQFREQLEEEVNLETVKKAHQEDEARREAEAKRSAADGSTTGTGTAAGGQEAGSASSAMSGAHADDPYTQPASSPNPAVGEQISPDLAKIRADTYSHAHPTDEFGANPLTTNGAAEPVPLPVAETAEQGANGYPSDGATVQTDAAEPSVRNASDTTSARTVPDGTTHAAHSSVPAASDSPASSVVAATASRHESDEAYASTGTPPASGSAPDKSSPA